mmetsp:Transcript_45740/g.74767  ORF Transcript_45740/g.74767 Transcript_45740/m.74767 type:complete len:365 (-) Transcript_45740:61-1155(-)
MWILTGVTVHLQECPFHTGSVRQSPRLYGTTKSLFPFHGQGACPASVRKGRGGYRAVQPVTCLLCGLSLVCQGPGGGGGSRGERVDITPFPSAFPSEGGSIDWTPAAQHNRRGVTRTPKCSGSDNAMSGISPRSGSRAIIRLSSVKFPAPFLMRREIVTFRGRNLVLPPPISSRTSDCCRRIPRIICPDSVRCSPYGMRTIAWAHPALSGIPHPRPPVPHLEHMFACGCWPAACPLGGADPRTPAEAVCINNLLHQHGLGPLFIPQGVGSVYRDPMSDNIGHCPLQRQPVCCSDRPESRHPFLGDGRVDTAPLLWDSPSTCGLSTSHFLRPHIPTLPILNKPSRCALLGGGGASAPPPVFAGLS